jgi:hypothetical protein
MKDDFSLVQLNTKTLETITTDNLDTVKKNVHISPENAPALKVLQNIGEVTGTLSSSGPLLGSGAVIKKVLDETDTGHQEIWRPDAGQIWQVNSISIKPTGGGSFSASISLQDSTSGERVNVDTQTTGSAADVVNIVNGPLFISNELFLSAYFGSQGTTGSETFIGAYRVR